MDLSDPESMALHLSNLLSDSGLRNKLVAAGLSELHILTFDRIGLLKKIAVTFDTGDCAEITPFLTILILCRIYC